MSQNTNAFNIKFLNADGSGFPEVAQVLPGTSIGDFFKLKKPGENPSNFNILVRRNGERLQLAAHELLQADDFVTILHSKREGA